MELGTISHICILIFTQVDTKKLRIGNSEVIGFFLSLLV